MKLPYILPILVALPFSAFAESSSTQIRPFVGYNISLAGTHHSEFENDGHSMVKTNGFSFNDNNNGDFIFGIEIDNIMAISLNASINTVTAKAHGAGTETEKSNEIMAKFDIYLTRESNFKPFVSLGAGYLSWDGTYKTSGALFGFGIGCKQYINDNVYVGASLTYNVSTEMTIKEINGLDVDDITMRLSGFDFGINAGYRF